MVQAARRGVTATAGIQPVSPSATEHGSSNGRRSRRRSNAAVAPVESGPERSAGIPFDALPIPPPRGGHKTADRSVRCQFNTGFFAFSLIRGEHRPRLDSAMREVIFRIRFEDAVSPVITCGRRTAGPISRSFLGLPLVSSPLASPSPLSGSASERTLLQASCLATSGRRERRRFQARILILERRALWP